MFDSIIRASLRHAWLVVAAALLLLGFGVFAARTLPVDVLPELSAPSVTVVTEANGLAPEEVERLVTTPLEQALNGAPGLRRLRSSSGVGISLVWVEFDWNVSPLLARQTVAEKLAVARGALPERIEPVLAPASSIMGEILFVGVTGDGSVSDGELREIAEWTVRRRLLAVPGVAQVVPIGGDVRRVEIVIDPVKLADHQVELDAVLARVRDAAESSAGGFVVGGAQEYLVRGVGRPESLDAIEAIRITERHGVAVTLRDLGSVQFGAAQRRGDAAVDGKSAVVLKIQKQPLANTLEVTARVDEAFDELQGSLPHGVELYRKGFRQADFIRVALRNVSLVLRDGAVLVAVVLILFLLSWRTTLISLLALPLSLSAGLGVLYAAGASINTMTLGGFAIAIGELVDDAIVDVENVHRRLGQNAARAAEDRVPVFQVVYEASKEIRGSVVFATAIILLVFAPLFFLSGVEGRLLQPLGLAYVASIGASLFVALTITPVLCLLLLGKVGGHGSPRESPLVRVLKQLYRPVVAATLRAPVPIAAVSLAGAVAAIVSLATFGRSFLPEFNEGSLNIAAATAPGTSLETSNAIVGRLERYLVDHPAVTSVIRSTGRAERDEHALDVNFSELEVGLDLSKGERDAVLAEIREQASSIPGLAVTVGQPISHRIEHLVSGVRASLALKIYGDDLDQLRDLARKAETAMRAVPGIVDISVEQQTEIPQIVILPRPVEAASFGKSPGDVARFVETAFAGTAVGTHYERGRAYDVVVRLPPSFAADSALLASTPIDVGGSRWTELGAIARVEKTMGPNLINHENAQRRMIVTANVSTGDLRGTATRALEAARAAAPLPTGYRMELGGQFESEATASRTILALSVFAIIGIVLLLMLAFRSARDALVVLFNLPLALVGGALAVYLGGGVVSIASLVGFITLFGIATRNGIMMVSHFRHVLTHEKVERADAVVQGSLDRLVPILMTALTAAIALIPIVLAAGEPGNEIQAPMGAVILGGLLSSTMLNLLVVPALFYRFGSRRQGRP